MSAEITSYEAINLRLNSIEQGMLDIRGLLERLVRVEERGLSIGQNISRIEAHLAALDERLLRVESSASRSGLVVGGIERGWWIIVTVIGSLFGAWFGRKL